MLSMDKFPISPEGTVRCVLRRRDMRLAECLACERLIEVDPAEPPHHIVCEARYALSVLGLDDDP